LDIAWILFDKQTHKVVFCHAGSNIFYPEFLLEMKLFGWFMMKGKCLDFVEWKKKRKVAWVFVTHVFPVRKFWLNEFSMERWVTQSLGFKVSFHILFIFGWWWVGRMGFWSFKCPVAFDLLVFLWEFSRMEYEIRLKKLLL
jgi:hypothetical protein